MDVITEKITSARKEYNEEEEQSSPTQTKRTAKSANKAPELTTQFWDRWEDPVSKESNNNEDGNMLKGWGPLEENNFIQTLFEQYDNPFSDDFIANHPSVLMDGNRFESYIERSRSRSFLDVSNMSKKSGRGKVVTPLDRSILH